MACIGAIGQIPQPVPFLGVAFLSGIMAASVQVGRRWSLAPPEIGGIAWAAGLEGMLAFSALEIVLALEVFGSAGRLGTVLALGDT